MNNSNKVSRILTSPPWEVLDLVARHLDPETLAIASCVSKSWSISMSSDHVWQPICVTCFPSISAVPPPIGFHRLYALGLAAVKRRVKTPSKPRLSLSNLIFNITISAQSTRIFSTTRHGHELMKDPEVNMLFKFDIKIDDDHDGHDCAFMVEGLEEVKMAWNVILEGWKGVFTVMDCKGKLCFAPGTNGWFSDELPSAGCCSINEGSSGIVADLKLGVCSKRGRDGKVRVNMVSVGILSVVSWRYVSLDEGLRYLQHFLLPS